MIASGGWVVVYSEFSVLLWSKALVLDLDQAEPACVKPLYGHLYKTSIETSVSYRYLNIWIIPLTHVVPAIGKRHKEIARSYFCRFAKKYISITPLTKHLYQTSISQFSSHLDISITPLSEHLYQTCIWTSVSNFYLDICIKHLYHTTIGTSVLPHSGSILDSQLC